MNCIFCEIAAGNIPATVLWETDSVIAIRDVSPQAPVHVLILPKKHIANVLELEGTEPDLLTNLLNAFKTVAQMQKVEGTGFRIVTNVGNDGGQSVNHLHFHLLGGREMTWPPG